MSVDVKNTSDVAGTDIVELYATTPDAPAALQRPVKRLEGFTKVALAPGETKTVSLDVKVADLAFFDTAEGRWELDQGRYGLQIGRSSADVALSTDITVDGALTPKVNVVTVKPAMAGDAGHDVIDRVIFPLGSMLKPNVTVAMSDDTLYGAGDAEHPASRSRTG